ncbi:MAG: HNH endonuclease [Asgard group archaeon]|nr:HNH endonuclease [Asgard group archaeon]
MNYIEKLKHPKWQEKRLRIFERDNFKCKICGENDQELHVHHKSYNNNSFDPWDVSNDDLITVCDDCHKLYHVKHDKIVKFVREVHRLMYTPKSLQNIIRDIIINNLSLSVEVYNENAHYFTKNDDTTFAELFGKAISDVKVEFDKYLNKFVNKLEKIIIDYYDKIDIHDPLTDLDKVSNETTL